MHRPLILRNTLAALSLCLLAGCMLVDDFSPAWKQGVTDACINKIAESIYLNEFRRDPADKDMSDHARTLTVGHEHFLMLKMDSTDAGGRLYRFGVVNGIFQRYRLNPTMRKTFEQDYPDAPVSLKNDTVTLATLDDDATKLLAEIAAKSNYWEIEDQTLYNTMLNPNCKFDDRDLKALIEDSQPKRKK